MSADERAALAFAGKTKILMACERYERRAISRRDRALRALAKLQGKLQREEAAEIVGTSSSEVVAYPAPPTP